MKANIGAPGIDGMTVEDAGMGRLASPQIPNVLLEALEEFENKVKESDVSGHPGMASVRGCVRTKRILASSAPRCCTEGNLEQKTRSSRIL